MTCHLPPRSIRSCTNRSCRDRQPFTHCSQGKASISGITAGVLSSTSPFLRPLSQALHETDGASIPPGVADPGAANAAPWVADLAGAADALVAGQGVFAADTVAADPASPADIVAAPAFVAAVPVVAAAALSVPADAA